MRSKLNRNATNWKNMTKAQETNNKFSRNLGHLGRVFLKNLFKTFLGLKHIVCHGRCKTEKHLSERALAFESNEELTVSDSTTIKYKVQIINSPWELRPAVCGFAVFNYLGTGNNKTMDSTLHDHSKPLRAIFCKFQHAYSAALINFDLCTIKNSIKSHASLYSLCSQL